MTQTEKRLLSEIVRLLCRLDERQLREIMIFLLHRR